MFNRTLLSYIKNDLKEKMVFLGGPRQVGKTTLALQLLPTKLKTDPAYLNWDILSAKKKILKNEIPLEYSLIVFDEIHKYSKWKNYMKGFYDEHFPQVNALVTGSARLNVYKKGGDSLLGRYHYYRMHPVSPLEISKECSLSEINELLKFGGFPEPLVAASEKRLKRWQNERVDRLIHEDLRDLEKVKDLSLLELLAEALPERVGSPLSIRSLQEDLQVAHDTVKNWVEIFDNLYFSFRISPFGSPKIRAVKKEQKLYLWDWSMVPTVGARFENFVASQLLRYCHFLTDTEGHKMELRFVRDIDLREIDFVVLKDKKPCFAVECKTGDKELSKNIDYFRLRTQIPLFYQVHLGKKDYGDAAKRGRVIPIHRFINEVLKV